MPEFEPIIGRYLSVAIGGAEHRIFVEEAGQRHSTAMPPHSRRRQPAIPPRPQRRGRHRPIPRGRLRSALPRPLAAARRLVAQEVPSDYGIVSGDDPRGLAGARAGAAGGDGLLDGRGDRAQARRRVPGRADRHRRAGKLGLCARALQRAPAPSRHPRRRALRKLHVRPQLAAEPGGEPARELVVLQPVGARRLPGRCVLLQPRLGRARGREAHRHQPLQGGAADRANTTTPARRP